MTRFATLLTPALLGIATIAIGGDYPIVDTGQVRCSNDQQEIEYPKPGEAFFGQDAQYRGHAPSYRDNGDGTVTDLVTDLMWQKAPGEKMTLRAAVEGASKCRTGGHDDWRLPSIKELYSLIDFSGRDIAPTATDLANAKPFIDNKVFRFSYGDPSKGERSIDSQMATSTTYVGRTMNGAATMFGVNFADGRIKGYPYEAMRPGRAAKTFYVYYVRGNPKYGENDFHDNGDGTVTDRATDLMWAKVDSGALKAGPNGDGRMNWREALKWAEDLEYGGHDDWRLPNAKELQSLVDYTRSPDTTRSAAIDPIFQCTPIKNAGGAVDFAHYWTGTTHKRESFDGYSTAVYIAFGRALGWMSFGGRQAQLMDVHGAGAQRSDPKAGDPSRYPQGRGPQGDVIGIYNMVRPVRGGDVTLEMQGPKLELVTRGGMQPGGAPGGFVQRLDRDGDGKVSRREFDGPPDAFDREDANHDGYLDESEAPRMPPGGMGPPPPGGTFQPPRRGGR